MLTTISKILGYTWAFPITLIGLVYALTLCVFKYYKWHGVEGDALVWVVDISKSPSWLKKLWKSWAGHAIGNVIVMKNNPSEKPIVLKHEQRHVEQVMRLGIFQPIIYAISSFGIYVACDDSDPYYSNPFEIDARRHAGQIIDIEGCIKKISSNELKIKEKE